MFDNEGEMEDVTGLITKEWDAHWKLSNTFELSLPGDKDLQKKLWQYVICLGGES